MIINFEIYKLDINVIGSYMGFHPTPYMELIPQLFELIPPLFKLIPPLFKLIPHHI